MNSKVYQEELDKGTHQDDTICKCSQSGLSEWHGLRHQAIFNLFRMGLNRNVAFQLKTSSLPYKCNKTDKTNIYYKKLLFITLSPLITITVLLIIELPRENSSKLIKLKFCKCCWGNWYWFLSEICKMSSQKKTILLSTLVNDKKSIQADQIICLFMIPECVLNIS